METVRHQAASQAITNQRNALAEAVAARILAQRPEYLACYGAQARVKCEQDTVYHLDFLSEAVAASSPALFADYVRWAKVLLAHIEILAADFAESLVCTQHVLREMLPADLAAVACEYVDVALRQLPELPTELPTYLPDTAPLASLVHEYLDALLRGERHAAGRLIDEAVQSGVTVKEIYLEVFQRSQREIGRLWQMNRLSVAQEHYCTAATQSIMSSLYPHIFGTARVGRTLVAACVCGDLHEIGLRIVSDFFEMEGWDTYYVGANTPTASIVDTVVRREADVLGLSATMLFHVPAVVEIIEAVRATERRGGVRILVGGYPFNVAPDLWQTVGADAYAPDAASAVAVANALEGR